MFILALPFAGFLIVKHLSEVNLRMPRHYVVKRVDKVSKNGRVHTDTVYQRMPKFDLINQLGHHITRNDLNGKIIVVDFFHTTGKDLSNRLSTVLHKIQNTYARSDTGLRILSITTDPVNDSITALKNYADRFNANHDIWWFVRGSKQQVKKIAQKDFEITLKKKDSGNVLYSPMLIVMDRYQYVRGYYNVLDSAQVRRCVRDISLLMMEKEKPGER